MALQSHPGQRFIATTWPLWPVACFEQNLPYAQAGSQKKAVRPHAAVKYGPVSDPDGRTWLKTRPGWEAPPPPATCTREGLGPGMGEYTCTVLETPLGIIQRDQHATGRQGLNDFMISLTRAALRDHAGQGFIEITGAP